MLAALSPHAPRQLAALYRTLARILSAGLPPLQAGLALEPEAYSGPARAVASAVADSLRSGGGVTEGARRAGSAVPRHHLTALAAGEQSGTLPRVLDELGAACEAEA